MLNKELLVADLIVHLLKKTTEFNFERYALPAIQRRLKSYIASKGIASTEILLLELLKQDKNTLKELTQFLTVTHTKFFRDEDYFNLIFTHVLPELSMFSQIKCWSIACSYGQEVYSIAYLLKAKGLSEKSTILGTDINQVALESAKSGFYSNEVLNELQRNFKAINALNGHSIVDDLIVNSRTFTFSEEITKHCHFATHNLITNASLGHMHLILCRNVLIYLTEDEQKRVIKDLIVASLEPGGFVVFGEAENLLDFAQEIGLEKVIPGINIYQYKP